MPKLRTIEDVHLLESEFHQHIFKTQCFFGISLKAGKATKPRENECLYHFRRRILRVTISSSW